MVFISILQSTKVLQSCVLCIKSYVNTDKHKQYIIWRNAVLKMKSNSNPENPYINGLHHLMHTILS